MRLTESVQRELVVAYQRAIYTALREVADADAEGIELRFLASHHSITSAGDLQLRADKWQSKPFTVPSNHLSDPLAVPARTLALTTPGDDPANPRAFHPAALPLHESAFAMTVHKAQGSEFDQVWLQLPRRDNRVLSRELLYTGITRARNGLHLAGSAEVIEAALARHASRWSGLAQRLSPSPLP